MFNLSDFMSTALILMPSKFRRHILVIAKVGLKCVCFDAFGPKLLDNLLRSIGGGIVVYCNRVAQCRKRKACGFSYSTCRTRRLGRGD